MHKFAKKISRRGTITIFLAIILSAIILVECTYVILVANLDRGLTLRRAVTLQVESYLAQYDRQLLKTYGIYAFDLDRLDDAVFREVLEANGLGSNDIIEVSGVNTFTAEDMRTVISYYYSYRMPGLLFRTFSDSIGDLLSNLDNSGVLQRFRQFMSSDAATILMNILDGAISVTDTIETIAETVNLDGIANSIGRFNRMIHSIDNALNGPLDPENGFNPDDLGFGLTAVTTLGSFYDNSAGIIDDYLFHPFAVNYATYNFDCRLDDDTALDGTEFSSFHSGNKADIEYILTGLNSSSARNLTGTYIYMVLVLSNIISVNTDASLRGKIQGVAKVLAVIVDFVSAGTIIIPSAVYEAVIIVIYGFINASEDLDELLDGERIEISNLKGLEDISLGYRDFVTFFMFFVSDEVLIQRMTEVINRDFDGYVTGLSLLCRENDGSEFEIFRGYRLYGIGI